MELRFADRMSNVSASAIREILKFASTPGFISLAAGSPANETFPAEALAEITARLLREQPNATLNYSVTEGYTPLRDYLKKYLKTNHNTGCEGDELIITSGAQQIMDLACKSLCNAGDVVICERPSFVGALNSYRSYGAQLVGVDMEEDGMDIAQLEEVMDRHPNAKLLYTIPNFQNPTGICTSWEKRQKIYELAKAHHIMIIEDNPYGDIRFEGQTIPNIKTIDDDNIVIYAGTLSKVLAPGLRIGYCLADRRLIAKMIVCKQCSDVHTAILPQMAAYEFLTQHDFEGHLDTIRSVYRKKAHFTMDLLNRKTADFLTYHPIEGGLFLWCKCTQFDMNDFCTKLAQNKVGVVPGTAFCTAPDETSEYFRINYSSPTEQQLIDGVAIMADIAKTM